MRFELHRDPARFAEQAGQLLEAGLEANLMATILLGILDGQHPEPPLFAVGYREPSESATWAALRTPPRAMVATPGILISEAGELVALWLEQDPELPGVNSVPATARPIAAALSARTGRPTRLRMSMAMHALDHVADPPQPAPGELCQATLEDRPLLVRWWEGFTREILDHARGDLVGLDARLQAGGMYTWQDGGRPVSMIGHAPVVAGVARIGPVYTPPALRGRGYAGTAVAALSRRLLAAGAQRCMLYTDLANPTSNKIYGEIGYRRLSDWEEHALE